MRSYFNFMRFFALLRLEFKKVGKGLLISALGIFGLCFIGLLLEAFMQIERVYDDHLRNFSWLILVGGYLFTSLAFNDLGNQNKRYIYLNLPVSTFERFLSMWLLTSVFWIVAVTTIQFLFVSIANPVARSFYPTMIFVDFDPFGEDVLEVIKYYFVTQGVFLVGAAYFRGYAFAKTILTLVILALVVMALFYFTLKDVFLSEHECVGWECELVRESAAHGVWPLAKALFWWVLAPVCWVLTYIGLQDQEA